MLYNKSLDSLRAVAVLLVVLVHYGYLDFGWIGVQLFFVLSGYLITTILLEDKRYTFKYYLKRFYWRRALRIFPLYYGYLILFAVFNLLAYPALFEPEREYFITYWPWLFTYTLNIGKILELHGGTYFFQHFWSLCVEEQFYLAWPLAVFFLPMRYFVRAIYLIIIIAPVARYFVYQYLIHKTGDQTLAGLGAYYTSICQFDSFAMGALIAAGKTKWAESQLCVPVYIVTGGMLIGLLNLLMLYRSGPVDLTSLGYPSLMHGNYQYVWGYTIVNLVGFGLIHLLNQRNPLSRLAQNQVFVWIGKISYGVYVFHYPILDLWGRIFRYDPKSVPGLIGFIGYLSLTLMVAFLSFRLYEKRFLDLKDWKFSRNKVDVNANLSPVGGKSS
ncbi:MAG: acyltransferase [Acidobacteriota bacterium]|nr:MAG: acyltransferase [Acidobacteriota bacterium]